MSCLGIPEVLEIGVVLPGISLIQDVQDFEYDPVRGLTDQHGSVGNTILAVSTQYMSSQGSLGQPHIDRRLLS